jgi:cytochrome c biogenesis protein ResB
MITGVLIFVLLVLFMLAGVFPVQGGMQVVIFQTPVFLIIAASLGISLFLCCRKRHFNLGTAGFQLTHLGVIVILAGALTALLTAKKSEFAVPISANHQIGELPASENSSYKLDFTIAVTNFDVQFYNQSEEGRGQTPRHFQASLCISRKDGPDISRELEVNHPVEYGGWRFFLMSYDTESRRYVVLSARHDPGRPVVFAGMAMLMVGSAIMCFRKKEADNAAS